MATALHELVNGPIGLALNVLLNQRLQLRTKSHIHATILL